jgi:hypothetical protein
VQVEAVGALDDPQTATRIQGLLTSVRNAVKLRRDIPAQVVSVRGNDSSSGSSKSCHFLLQFSVQSGIPNVKLHVLGAAPCTHRGRECPCGHGAASSIRAASHPRSACGIRAEKEMHG